MGGRLGPLSQYAVQGVQRECVCVCVCVSSADTVLSLSL